jgi:8-oxo-dGTP diphosphatase
MPTSQRLTTCANHASPLRYQCIGSASSVHFALYGWRMSGLIEPWTGRTACALQAAMRMTNDAFAAHLGIAVRTVAAWHQKPALTPRAEIQQLLDTALDAAPAAVRARFTALVAAAASPPPGDAELAAAHTLTVAIAVVVRDSSVLVVQRRSEDGSAHSWQFPAGVVKPGMTADTVAIRETYAETGVHCAVARSLGSRLHPITRVMCEYLLCDYLTGEAENRDIAENVSVTWAPTARLTSFIPTDRIYPPILDALEVPR